MKRVLVFLVLIALVICNPLKFNREERQKKRREFQKQITECILKSKSLSPDFKKQLEESKDVDLRKVLQLFMNKLDSNDREVIRKCRNEIFGKIREMVKDKFHEKLNASHHLIPNKFVQKNKP